MKKVIKLIESERVSQVFQHGRTVEYDYLNNSHYQLSNAAQLLLWINEEDLGVTEYSNIGEPMFEHVCPPDWDYSIFHKMMNKPYKERCIISCALLVAEIERLRYIDFLINKTK